MTVWVAVLGFIGALAGSWGGQLIANKREKDRWEHERRQEEIRWQREREQRVLEARTSAYGEALLAVQRWHTALGNWASHLYNPDTQLPVRKDFSALEESARSAAAAVELLGSADVALRMREAVRELSRLNFNTLEKAKEAFGTSNHYGNVVKSDNADRAVEKLREATRIEITKLSGETPAIHSPVRDNP
jgi:hypothetical protein